MKRIIVVILLLFALLSEHIFALEIDFDVDVYYENSALNVYVKLDKTDVSGVVAATLSDDSTTVATQKSEAAKNVVLKFPENVTGDTVKVFLWDSFFGMKPLSRVKEITLDGELMLETVLNFEQPGTSGGYAGQTAVDGDFVYMCRQGMIYKLDMSDENNPVVVAQNNYSQSVTAKMATAVQINGDYIYVGNRLAAAGYPKEEEEANLTAGTFAVLKKSDLSLVSITPLGKKVSGMAMHKNLLIVNEQMLGWAIYDVSNPAEPVLLEDVDFARGTSTETQGGEIFEVQGKVYYAVAGFGDGIRMYDITEFVDYIETPEKFETVPTIGDDNLLWYYHFYSHGIGGNHTYDLTVKYPYVYATIAAVKAQKDNPDRVQGILTLDIASVEEAPKSHVLSMIANEDKNDMTTNSDTQPSIICRVGDWLVVNNDSKGIAYFDISSTPQAPEYKGVYNPFEGSCIYRIIEDKGRLFLTDGSGAGSDPRLYIVEGFGK